MSWAEVGDASVGPQDREVLVGPFLLEEDADTLWVRVTQTSSADCPVWNYSYGLLSWRSVEGHELGTVKVYGNCYGEVFKLSTGLPPSQPYGDLIFTPRAYNRRWISIDEPPLWNLTFEAQSGKSGQGPSVDLPSFGTRATLGVLSDLAGIGVSYAITGSETPYAVIKLLK